jgi:hypothetical protein
MAFSSFPFVLDWLQYFSFSNLKTAIGQGGVCGDPDAMQGARSPQGALAVTKSNIAFAPGAVYDAPLSGPNIFVYK